LKQIIEETKSGETTTSTEVINALNVLFEIVEQLNEEIEKLKTA